MKTFLGPVMLSLCLLIGSGPFAEGQAQSLTDTLKEIEEHLKSQASEAKKIDPSPSSAKSAVPVEAAPASQITLKSLETVDKGELIGGLTLSRDGKRLWYGRSDRTGHFMIVRELATHKLIRSIPVPDSVETLGLSPDERSVIYCYGQFGKLLGVLNVNTGKTVVLPRHVSNCSKSTLLWDSPNAVKVIAGGLTYILDLEKLTETSLYRNDNNWPTASPEEISKEINGWLAQYYVTSHKYAKLVDGHAKGLLVVDKRSNYSRQLLETLDEEWVASPDLHHVAINDYTAFGEPRYTLLIGHLGTRPAVQLEFTLDFNPSLLGDKADSLRGILAAGNPVYGKIYEPEINPLNGAVTGPNRSRYKGTVQIVNQADRWIVRVLYEEKEIRKSDIVSDIYSSELDPMGRVFSVESFWTRLDP